jgi:hypothetical protein
MFEDYGILAEDRNAYEQFKSAMTDACHCLRGEYHFIRLMIIKDVLGLASKDEWTVICHNKGDDVELEYVRK